MTGRLPKVEEINGGVGDLEKLAEKFGLKGKVAVNVRWGVSFNPPCKVTIVPIVQEDGLVPSLPTSFILVVHEIYSSCLSSQSWDAFRHAPEICVGPPMTTAEILRVQADWNGWCAFAWAGSGG